MTDEAVVVKRRSSVLRMEHLDNALKVMTFVGVPLLLVFLWGDRLAIHSRGVGSWDWATLACLTVTSAALCSLFGSVGKWLILGASVLACVALSFFVLLVFIDHNTRTWFHSFLDRVHPFKPDA